MPLLKLFKPLLCQQFQIRKHDVNDGHFKSHALLVMNNFSKDVNHQKLTASMFQNMFPSININQVRLILWDYVGNKSF